MAFFFSKEENMANSNLKEAFSWTTHGKKTKLGVCYNDKLDTLPFTLLC